MQRAWMVLRGALLVVSGVYVGYGLLLWWFQEKLLFHPPGVGRDQLDAAAAEVGAQPLELVASDGTKLYAWLRRSGAGGRRLVLHFPGNAETVGDNLGLQRLLVTEGWDVLIGGYRGYPGSEGKPSEAGLGLDATAAWEWAIGPGGYAPEHIVVHGRSLGGGVAALLVDGPANPAALVLESTFASVTDLAADVAPGYPVSWLLRNPFSTKDRAPRLGVPVFLVHTTDDEVIPIDKGGRAMKDRFAEVEYHEVSGYSHNHCLPVSSPEVREAYLAFLRRFAGE